MDVNLRKDGNFVQDDRWYESRERYRSFMQGACRGNTLLLELGVGYNTPAIIRFPFEELASRHGDITLARVNRDFAEKRAAVHSFIPFREEMGRIISDMAE